MENRALRKIVGVPISTRILDLHLESNIPPIKTRWEASVAFQSEKYRRHSISDPLNILAYKQIKPRLKRKSWQTTSNEIFKRINVQPFKKIRTSYENTSNITQTSS